MSKRKEILKQVGSYSFATEITQVIAIAGGILTRNLLGPLQMGMWTTLQIILHYSSYTQLGTTAAISREIPYYLGKNDSSKAESIKNLVSSFQILVALITSILLLVGTVLFRDRLSAPMFWGLCVIAGLILLQRGSNLMIGILRAYKNFTLVSRQMILSALVNLALIACLAYFFELFGFLAAMVLSFVFNIAYLGSNYDFRFRLCLSGELKGLIAFGFPLMILGVIGAVIKSIDKIVIVKMLGFEAVGFYSVAVMVSNFLNNIPNSMGIIMIPHFQEKYGTRDSVADVKDYVDKATHAFLSFMPFLTGMCWIMIPILVRHILPQYTAGIQASKYLVLGSFFTAVMLPYGNFIVTIKQHMKIFPVIAAILVLAVLLNIGAINLGLGIAGVAVATTLTLCVNFLGFFALAFKTLYGRREGWMLLGTIFARFTGLFLVLIFMDQFLVFESLGVQTSVHGGIFSLINIPFLYSLQKRYGLLELLTKKFQKIRPDKKDVIPLEGENDDESWH